MANKNITLYDILMMCSDDEIVDIIYNGYAVVLAKNARDMTDLLEIIDDDILQSLVFRIEDEFGKIRIHCTEELKGKVEDYE